jgi:hypothetical protein
VRHGHGAVVGEQKWLDFEKALGAAPSASCVLEQARLLCMDPRSGIFRFSLKVTMAVGRNHAVKWARWIR